MIDNLDNLYIIIPIVLIALLLVVRKNKNSYGDRYAYNYGKPSKPKDYIGKAKIDAMLEYLRMRTPCSRREFVIPMEMYNDLYNSGFSQSSVRKVAYTILNYLRVDATKTTIKVEYVDPSNYQSDSGLYQTDSVDSVITVRASNKCSVDQIIAVICHECTHHFMRLKNLYAKENLENEFLTDVTAIYLGFGDYIQRGYDVVVQEQVIGLGTINRQTTSIGYLNNDEIQYVIKRVKEIRKKAINSENK